MMSALRVITIAMCIMENVSTHLAPTTAVVYMATLGMDSLITAVSIYSILDIMSLQYLHTSRHSHFSYI